MGRCFLEKDDELGLRRGQARALVPDDSGGGPRWAGSALAGPGRWDTRSGRPRGLPPTGCVGLRGEAGGAAAGAPQGRGGAEPRRAAP